MVGKLPSGVGVNCVLNGLDWKRDIYQVQLGCFL